MQTGIEALLQSNRIEAGLKTIADKIHHQQRITEEDGLLLFEKASLQLKREIQWPPLLMRSNDLFILRQIEKSIK